MFNNKICKPLYAILAILLATSCNNSNMSNTTSYPLRLKPGQKLKEAIEAFVVEHQIKAGWVATCAGSLTQYHIRFANQPQGAMATGHFEIVALSGTVSTNGSHLHIAVSDSLGHTIGGHLLQDNIIYTTAEIVIQSSNSAIFTREKDGTTPWEELQIKPAR
jgi:uncharacterized protein